MKFIIGALVAAVLGGLVVAFLMKPPLSAPQATQTAFERVVASRTIRCVYAVWEPDLIVDPNTKALSGVEHDIFEAVGRALGYKVEWVEQAGYDTFTQNLLSGREDVMCVGVWPSSARAPYLDFTVPPIYSPLFAYARADDARFDGALEKANDPAVTVAVVDGDTTAAIAHTDFAKAKTYSLPQQSEGSMLLLALTTRKADIAFLDPTMVAGFERTSPGQIRQVKTDKPVRIFGEPFAVAKGETKLRDMLNVALTEIIQDGTVDAIIAKYPDAAPYFKPVDPFVARR